MKRHQKRLLTLAALIIAALTLVSLAIPASAMGGNDLFPHLSAVPHFYRGDLTNTGMMNCEVFWDDVPELHDGELFVTVVLPDGRRIFAVQGDTRPRAGTSGMEESDGWSFRTGSDGRNRLTFQVPVLGKDDLNKIIDTVNKFLAHKVTGHGEDLTFESLNAEINGVLQKIKSGENSPEAFGGEPLSALSDLLNKVVDRGFQGGNFKLSAEEEQTLAGIIASAMGTGWAPAAGCFEGCTVEVSLQGLVQGSDGQWTATDNCDPVTFPVNAESEGKTFGYGAGSESGSATTASGSGNGNTAENSGSNGQNSGSNTPKDGGSGTTIGTKSGDLTWLWILLGLLAAAAVGAGVYFGVLKSRAKKGE